ncbi:MAG: hypothetical protein ACT4P5_17160 [Armatimonadota bacterium]
MQRAYRLPTYAAAHAELQRLHQDLRRRNEDAARSLAEGLDETLTLHRVGLADRLGVSLNTTNGLESILAVVEQRVGNVDRWTTSDQKQRWLATALLEIEPRLRRLCGYRALPQLRIALRPLSAGEGGEGSVMSAGGCSQKIIDNPNSPE